MLLFSGLLVATGIGWITALKNASIRTLVEQGQLQLGLFDERNLIELSSPDGHLVDVRYHHDIGECELLDRNLEREHVLERPEREASARPRRGELTAVAD